MPTKSCLHTRAAALAFALVTALAGGVANAQSGFGDSGIHPKPSAAPALPAAGQAFVDPTFGTTIVRITDPTNAPQGAGVNSSPIDSMFNADGSMFYLPHRNEGWMLYGFDRSTNRATRLGALPANLGLAYDGAVWDPTDPSVLYAIVQGSGDRTLHRLTLPAGTAVPLHNFSNEVPTGGYPSSRIQVSPDGRYFAALISTTGGQDTYNYDVVWDRVTGATKVLSVARMGGAVMHAHHMDTSGNYIIFEEATGGRRWVWHWGTDVVTGPYSGGSPDYFSGHLIPGWGEVLHSGPVASTYVRRPLADSASFSSYLQLPTKDGKSDWFEDSHYSRVLVNDSYVQSHYVTSFAWNTFTLHGGAVYKLTAFLSSSADFAAPEVFRYKGRDLVKVSGVPTAPGRWSYDASTDVVYVWLPDGSNPQANRSAIAVFDWRPTMDEIVQVVRTSDQSWTWRRFAHHRMTYTGDWDASPRGNVDPTGTLVLFQSNWDATLQNADGTARKDVFLAVIPALPGTPTGPTPSPSPAPSPTPSPDTTRPAVALTSPSSGASVAGTVTISMTATDNVGVTMTKYYVDGNAIGAFSPPKMQHTWDSTSVANGSHTLTVAASDAAGNTTQATSTVTVRNPAPPSVVITSPVNGSRLGADAKIAVTASDDTAVSSITARIDGNVVGTKSCGTASCSTVFSYKTKSLARGWHTITATATDTSGVSSVATISVRR